LKESFHFRWPVKQVDEHSVEMEVPMSRDGIPPINKQFIESQQLSDSEVGKAERAVIRAIALID
jgi:hypothetical protein